MQDVRVRGQTGIGRAMLPSLVSRCPAGSVVVGFKSCPESQPLRLQHHTYERLVVSHIPVVRSSVEGARALFPTPILDTRKLTVSYMSAEASDVEELKKGQPRRYTVTHNDLTAQLHLSIGEDFNQQQISGWYSRLVRDEVVAEWSFAGGPALHLHCHVSGAAFWLASAHARNSIFTREMPLVLDSIAFAERRLFAGPELQGAAVFVHFEACETDISRVEYWGTVGEWVHRDQCMPVREHLDCVSYTMLGARPAIPRAARLEGSLSSLLDVLAVLRLDTQRAAPAPAAITSDARPKPPSATQSASASTHASGTADSSAAAPVATTRGSTLSSSPPRTPLPGPTEQRAQHAGGDSHTPLVAPLATACARSSTPARAQDAPAGCASDPELDTAAGGEAHQLHSTNGTNGTSRKALDSPPQALHSQRGDCPSRGRLEPTGIDSAEFVGQGDTLIDSQKIRAAEPLPAERGGATQHRSRPAAAVWATATHARHAPSEVQGELSGIEKFALAPERGRGCSEDVAADSVPRGESSQTCVQGAWRALYSPLRCAVCGGEVARSGMHAAAFSAVALSDCSPAQSAAAHAARAACAVLCTCSHYSWSAETAGLEFLGEFGVAPRQHAATSPGSSDAVVASRCARNSEPPRMHVSGSERDSARESACAEPPRPSPIRQLAATSTRSNSRSISSSAVGASCRASSARVAWERQIARKRDSADTAAQHAAQSAGHQGTADHPQREPVSRICFSRRVRNISSRRRVHLNAGSAHQWPRSHDVSLGASHIGVRSTVPRR